MAELAGSGALSEFTEALSPAHIKSDVISPSLQEAKSLPESSDTGAPQPLQVTAGKAPREQLRIRGLFSFFFFGFF